MKKNVPWHILAPSAHPRGAFLSYGNEVSYTIKELPEIVSRQVPFFL